MEEADFKEIGDTLRHASLLRAKAVYEGFIHANILSEDVTIDEYDVDRMRRSLVVEKIDD